MKLLGIDYGRKRLGIATCGALRIACPLKILYFSKQEKDLFAELGLILREREIEKIIVGLPKNMDDSSGEMVKEVEKFAERLKEEFSLPIILWDERLTTYEADRILKEAGLSPSQRKKRRDAIAAALILQSYVDSQMGKDKMESYP